MAKNDNLDGIREEIVRDLTESQKDRDVVEFSTNVNNFMSTLMDRTLTDSELNTELEKKLMVRLMDINPDTEMSDGALVELFKATSKSKTDNANVIANIVKGMADALLLKKGLEKDGAISGDLTKKDVEEVRGAISDIQELRKFMNEVIKTEK